MSEIIASCPHGCTHTDDEHRAFDAGWEAGAQGEDDLTNPYTTKALWRAWRWGWEYGMGDQPDDTRSES